MESELEKELRAIALSCPKGEELTVRKLYNEYHEIIGCNVPFEKLGFSSFLDYLKSIPHVIKVSNGYYTWDSDITPVVSSSTAHIRNLVMGQKPSSTKSKGRCRNKNTSKPGGSKGEKSSNSSCRQWSTWEFDERGTDEAEDDYFLSDTDEESSDEEYYIKSRQKQKSKLVLPAEFRRDMETLLACNPNGILLNEIGEMYKVKFRRELNQYNFGYSRLIDFLPDTDMVKLYELKDSCFLVMDARKLPVDDTTAKTAEKKLATIVKRVMEIVKTRQNIFMDEMEHEYYEKYKEQLDFKEFGFDRNLGLYQHLKDIWDLHHLKNGRIEINQKKPF